MATTYKAILIGNNDFPNDPHGLQQLNGPINDVRVLRSALTHPEKGLFEKTNVQTLENATTREILIALEQFYANARNTDQLLFYYSGHGCKDDLDQLYLCGQDSMNNRLISTAIPDKLINSMLENSSSKKNIIILDCCNSGNFKSGELPQSLQGEGRFVITSSHSNQLSRDTDNTNHPSPFTKYLAEALLADEIDTNSDGFISINEVYEYVFPKLHQETKQRPQRKFGNTVGDLPLCKRKPTTLQPSQAIEHKTMNLGSGKPKLNVSEQTIQIRAVGFDEQLNDEIIDIFNEGSGELDWEATTEFDWITLESHDTYIKVKLSPKVGMNRGSIRICDRNGGGSKTVRFSVEKLDRPQQESEPLQPEVDEEDQSDSFDPNAALLATFDNVTMRHPNNAKATTDSSEQQGKLLVYADRVELRAQVSHVITSIRSLDYYPQNINPGFTFNYMGITGNCNNVSETMYFYIFSWMEAGKTWKMIEQIYDLIVKKKLKVDKSFVSHMQNDSQLQKSSPNLSKNNPPTQPTLTVYIPGNWQIAIFQFGQQVATLQLQFNVSGAVSGSQQSNQGYSQINGTWAFNSMTNILNYNVMVNFMSGAVPESGTVRIVPASATKLSGTDHLNRQWTFTKVM